MNTITEKQVREAVADSATAIICDFKSKPDTDRKTLIKRVDGDIDWLFGYLVQSGPLRFGVISDYNARDLAATAQPCGVIIKVAEDDAHVDADGGLWEGLQFGILASMAFSSLRNLLCQKLVNLGYDSNDDYPFAVEVTP